MYFLIDLFFFSFISPFFLKAYKNEENTKILQEIYVFFFCLLELNICEVGYGDQSINKKMKDYINLFHNIISEIHFWDDLNKLEKQNKFSSFIQNSSKIDHIIDYFEEFNENLSKKNLISFLNSVSNK